MVSELVAGHFRNAAGREGVSGGGKRGPQCRGKSEMPMTLGFLARLQNEDSNAQI